MERKAILLACALTLAAAAPLPAGEGKECAHGKRGFSDEKFDKMDADGDGKLTFEELRSAKEARLEKWYDRADADGDGALTKEELASAKDEHEHHGKKTETE